MKLLFLILLLFTIGCSALKTFSSNEEKLYYEKCGGCHRVHEKNEYNAKEWVPIFQKMKVKARLSSEESKSLENFLLN